VGFFFSSPFSFSFPFLRFILPLFSLCCIAYDEMGRGVATYLQIPGQLTRRLERIQELSRHAASEILFFPASMHRDGSGAVLEMVFSSRYVSHVDEKPVHGQNIKEVQATTSIYIYIFAEDKLDHG